MDSHISLGLLLPQVAIALTRYYEHCLQSHLGISFAQYKILHSITERPYIKQKDIARMLGQTEASISRHIKRMYDDGLITTKQRSDDRREHITELTRRGERLSRNASRILNANVNPLFAHLTANEQKALVKLLHSLNIP
jgi:DNA-binding MarR family transcriptional regulator